MARDPGSADLTAAMRQAFRDHDREEHGVTDEDPAPECIEDVAARIVAALAPAPGLPLRCCDDPTPALHNGQPYCQACDRTLVPATAEQEAAWLARSLIPTDAATDEAEIEWSQKLPKVIG